MRDSPSACVADANVIIDLHVGGLLPKALRHPFQLVAPDFITDELVNPSGKSLVREGLQEQGLTPEEINNELPELKARYPSDLSINDLAALFVAKKMGLMLLTGERLLRQAAEAEGVTVRGTLWLLNHMVSRKVVPPRRAAEAIVRIRRVRHHLHGRNAEQLLARWRRG